MSEKAYGSITVIDVNDGVSIADSIPYYLASAQSTGVTINDAGWSRIVPQLTSTNRYLWVYYVSRYGVGQTEPELITESGSIVTFDYNGDPSPVDDVVVDIEPVQDLHGYDYPWPAGGGKNLIPYPYKDGDSRTASGITFTTFENGKIHVQGTATATVYFNLYGSSSTSIP